MVNKIDFYIQPRCTGKTALCAQLLKYNLQHNKNTVMFVAWDKLLEDAVQRYGVSRKYILTQDNYNGLMGRGVHTLILDDWLLFKTENMREIVAKGFCAAEEVVIRTTSDRLYDIEFLNEMKAKMAAGVSDVPYTDEDREILEKASWSQLLNPDANIINMTMSYTKEPEAKKILSEDMYRIEWLGHYMK